MIAATRERRQNAGAKMSQLLQNLDDVDDFYKSQYGGFNEEENDAAYNSPVHSESDQFDSDFGSSDESDEPIDDDESVAKQEKKTTGGKKIYKEPTYIKKVSTPKPKSDKNEAAIRRTKSYDDCTTVDKKLRASTLQKSVMSEKFREAAKRQRDKRRPYTKPEGYRITQAEMLAEAKETEKINLNSLETYEKYEEEMERKRKAKMNKKRKIVGPKISYLSTAMPLMTEESTIVGQEKYERTFIILSEDCANVDDILPSTATQPKVKPMKSYCPVTGLPAKYFDPVTNTPYATLEAFKTIREAYYQHVEELGNRKDPAVAAWLAQRRAQMV